MIFRVSTFFLLVASSLCLAWDSDEGLRGLHSHSKSHSKSHSDSKTKSHSKSKSLSKDSFDRGLDKTALDELAAAGLFNYLDQFTAIGVEVGEGENPDYQNPLATFDDYKELKYTDSLGFTKFTWDPLPNGIPYPSNGFEDENPRNGPSCIFGTPYSAYSRAAPRAAGDSSSDGSDHRTSKDLLIFLQGGGACWEGFANCNVLAEDQAPAMLLGETRGSGIFNFEEVTNPFKEYNIIYAPYCSGDAWIGDNLVVEPIFTDDPVTVFSPIGGRNHRGIRNLSVTLELAKDQFPNARSVTLMGHSAGGVGASTLGAALVRKIFGNDIKITIFNDAGPTALNQDEVADAVARASDWRTVTFLPDSCVDDGRCVDDVVPGGAAIGFADWYLEHDSTVRVAFYSALWDVTQRFFTRQISAPPPADLIGSLNFQTLLLATYGNSDVDIGFGEVLSVKYPGRFNSFFAASLGFTIQQVPLIFTHGLVQDDAFYSTALGRGDISLSDWTTRFLDEDEDWENVIVVDDALCSTVVPSLCADANAAALYYCAYFSDLCLS